MAVALGAYLYPGKCAYDTSWQPDKQQARCSQAEPKWRLQQAHLKLLDCQLESCRGEKMIPRASSRPNLSMYCPMLYPVKSMEVSMPRVPQCHILRIVEEISEICSPKPAVAVQTKFRLWKYRENATPGGRSDHPEINPRHILSSNFPRHSVLPLIVPPNP